MAETESRRIPFFFGTLEGWVLPVLVGLAFAVRLYMVFHTFVITNDGVLYVKMAKLISAGEAGRAFDLLFFSLYPLIIAAFQKVFGDWELSAQMVSAVFGSLTIIPLYFLIRSQFSRTVALISSTFFVFHPYLVRFSAEVVRGPTFWFVFMTALWVGWEAISRKRAWLFFLTGLLGVVSFLLRPEGILVIPIFLGWVLVRDWGTFRTTYRQRISFGLILLLTVPVLFSPTVLYLKKKTGHWHWARAEEIPRLALSDITMSHIKRNLDKIEVKPWGNSKEARLELIRLRFFLSLAVDHRIGIVALELLSKFQKAMHPFLLILLAFGTIRRKYVPYHRREELFLLSVLAILFLVLFRYGTVIVYIGTRHMMVPVMLCLAWAGAGVVELEHRIRNTSLAVKSTNGWIVAFRYLRWMFLILVIISLLPKTLASQRVDKIPIMEAGLWIKKHAPKKPVVMTQEGLLRVAFYADGTFLEIPQDEALDEYVKKREVDFLAINEKDIQKTHPGLIDSLNSSRFRKEVVLGKPSGPYVIWIYSLGS